MYGMTYDRLVDLENSLLGLPVIYRSFLLELRKAQGAEAEAIYSFGHLLYEMIAGKPLKTATMEAVPPYTSPNAGILLSFIRVVVILVSFSAINDNGMFLFPSTAEVLQALLSPTGVKALPSIAEVLAKP